MKVILSVCCAAFALLFLEARSDAQGAACFALDSGSYESVAGPMYCVCPGGAVLAGFDLGKARVDVKGGGGSMGGGVVNCYQVTVLADEFASLAGPGAWKVTQVSVPAKRIHRKCDASGCWSFLFISGGSASCDVEAVESFSLKSWALVGPCEDDVTS